MSAGKNVVTGLVAFVFYVQVVPFAMAAPNRIHGVSVSSQGQATVVEITGERAPNFTTFKQDSPRRVIVDVAESDLGGVPGSIRGDGNVVSAVTTAQYGSPPHGISRFIIALNREAEYRVTTQGGSLYVRITPGTGGLLVSAGVPVAPRHRTGLAASAGGTKDDLDLPLDVQPSAEADEENTPAGVGVRTGSQEEGHKDTKYTKAAKDTQSETAPALVAMADRQITSSEQGHAVAAQQPQVDSHPVADDVSSTTPVVVAQSDDEIDDTESSESEGDEDVDEMDQADSESDEIEDSEDSDSGGDTTDIDDSVPVSDDVDDSGDAEDEPPPPAGENDSMEDTDEIPPPAPPTDEEEVPPPPEADDDEEEMPPPPASSEVQEEVPEAVPAASEEVPPPPPPPATADDSLQEDAVPEAPASESSDYSEVEERVEVSGALKDMTWVGFQQTMEASRVFIKTNEPVKFHVTEEGDNLVVLELENTRIPLRNNTRFLDTHFFDSAVTMITPREIEGVSQNVRIEIQLRGKVPYTAGQDENMVYLDFRRQ